MAKLRMHVDADDDRQVAATIGELTRRYERWSRSRGPRDPGVVDVSDLELLLDWKIHYEDGELDRWTGRDVEAFLLGWCPRKLSVPAEMAAQIPENVAAAFEFLAAEGLLSSSSAPGGALAEHARALAPQFIAKMSDPANFGMAKTLFAGLGDAEPTPETLEALMADFNALPFDERAAITDPFLGAGAAHPDDPWQGQPPTLGPVVLPADQDIRASAAAAPVLAGFAALADYFAAPGRPLTAKGNIRLADAEALAGIIGTEPIADDIGGTTFRRRSVAEMPALDHWQWWAREAGALRTRNKRMVGVAAWRKRMQQDPLPEARKAFEVLVDHGVTGSYLVGRTWGASTLTDMMVAPLLALMLGSAGPVEFSTLAGVTLQARADVELPPLFDSPDLTERLVRSDLELALTLLERAGVLTVRDPAYQESAYTDVLVEAAVELTPFGILMAVEGARAAGFEVTTIDSVGDMTAAAVADLAVQQQVGVERWWDLVSSWAGAQSDGRQAVADLFDALAGHEVLLVALEAGGPAALHDDVADVLREAWDTRAPTDPLAAAAFGWLVGHERIDPASVPDDDIVAAHITVLAQAAAADPESVPDLLGEQAPREDLLALVARAASLMPPNVVDFLDAVGRHHPDKVVAKSARRELMRVRSRLANQRRG